MKNNGLYYQPQFLAAKDKASILQELQQFFPIWEERYSASSPPPAGKEQRTLLRPVYWLGNWQFACLNYYHPPKGIENRCVKAESYPPHLHQLVERVETLVHNEIQQRDIPPKWHLNTCLINFYGDRLQNNRKIDCARVGEHKDFEPGPVVSVSFGERALFQFVRTTGRERQSQVVLQQWLEDSSVQIFAGDRFKKNLFHRVQRVEKKTNFNFNLPEVPDFLVRRINLTFRYVPTDHIVEYKKLPPHLQRDVKGYVQQLASHSPFWNEVSSGN